MKKVLLASLIVFGTMSLYSCDNTATTNVEDTDSTAVLEETATDESKIEEAEAPVVTDSDVTTDTAVDTTAAQ